MSSVVSPANAASHAHSSRSARAEALADRLEQGARQLASFASTLSDADWQTRVPGDWRTVGVIVHHVASVYPVEIHLAQLLASGQAVEGVTMDNVHEMNAVHAVEHAGATRQEAIDLLHGNSAAAAGTIRAFSDEELDRAAPASLYANAPITCQFMLEDHAVRHSYHHLARLKAVLKR